MFIVFAWLGVFYFRSQFLFSLLSLELAALGLFMGLMVFYSCVGLSVSFSFYLLVLAACEASLGLSLLVVMARFGGSDLFSLISFTKC